MTDKTNNDEFLAMMKEKMSMDYFAALTGIELVLVKPGYAKTKLEIKKKHLNATGVVQGGAVFTLADFALAAATNYDTNVALVIDCQIAFLHPTKEGSTLWAETEQISDSNSLTSYMIKILNEENKLVAQYYGRAFKKKNKK
ncbi:MAG: PaaI family thioesterase [Syntrophomonadaceae bacterium]|nr:PaaI family thioesterase [Syntrophomonadaceae bacterium]